MKAFKLVALIGLITLFLTSCVSVRVTSDYDSETDFSQYKTFAFYKKGIDKSKISDIDKKRILRAIESELIAKGMTKSNKPDILVSIFAKSKKHVNVYNDNFWFPNYYGSNWQNNYSNYVEGTLLIDLIDSNKKTLLWQGVGKGALSTSKKIEKKEIRIKEFVTEIMAVYPPIK